MAVSIAASMAVSIAASMVVSIAASMAVSMAVSIAASMAVSIAASIVFCRGISMVVSMSGVWRRDTAPRVQHCLSQLSYWVSSSSRLYSLPSAYQ